MEENSTQVKSLVQRLAEACDEVGGIEKKGVNEAQKYKYIKAADVAKAIRHELFSRGIVIVPNEIGCNCRQLTFTNAKGETRNVNEVELYTQYVITDGKEKLEMHGYGIAWDSGDKAIYKAKTGALKYFLRGLGLIPDEKDDPEADESVDRAIKGHEDAFEERAASEPVAENLFNAAYKTWTAQGKTGEQIEQYCQTNFGKAPRTITRAELDQVFKWAAGKEPLQQTLDASVKSLPANRGQIRTTISPLVGEDNMVEVKGVLANYEQAHKGDKTWLAVFMVDDVKLSDWDLGHAATYKSLAGQDVTFLAKAKTAGKVTYYNVESIEMPR